MSLDKGLPGPHLLGRTGIFGTPYHGTVQSGLITLPNATTRTYTQPEGVYPDVAGATHLLRKPGQPAVTRTPEQEAADLAAGREWRNVAMLSGGRQQLYGQNLQGWIYIDPDGGRWLIQFVTDIETVIFAIGTPLSIQMRVSRFGVFGGEPQTFLTTLNLTDWGQSGYPAQPTFRVGTTFPNVTSAGFFLEAVTPTGSKAAINVHFRRTTSSDSFDSTVDVTVRHSLGWLEIAVSMVDGLPALSLSVLKNRGETLSIITNSSVGTAGTDTTEPALISGGGTTRIVTGSFVDELETKRLFAVWVDPETDEWRWLAVRYRYDRNTASTFLGTYGLSYVVETESTIEHAYAIELDDVEQMAFEVSIASLTTRTATYSGSGSAVVITLQDQGGDYSATIDGTLYEQTLGAGSPETGSAGSNATLLAGPVSSSSGVLYGASSVEMALVLFMNQWRFSIAVGLVEPDPNLIRLDVCRQSSQVITLRAHITSGGVGDVVYFPRLTPVGLIGSKVTRAFSATERLYGSWCPHTGEVVSMQASPICWV